MTKYCRFKNQKSITLEKQVRETWLIIKVWIKKWLQKIKHLFCLQVMS